MTKWRRRISLLQQGIFSSNIFLSFIFMRLFCMRPLILFSHPFLPSLFCISSFLHASSHCTHFLYACLCTLPFVGICCQIPHLGDTGSLMEEESFLIRSLGGERSLNTLLSSNKNKRQDRQDTHILLFCLVAHISTALFFCAFAWLSCMHINFRFGSWHTIPGIPHTHTPPHTYTAHLTQHALLRALPTPYPLASKAFCTTSCVCACEITGAAAPCPITSITRRLRRAWRQWCDCPALHAHFAFCRCTPFAHHRSTFAQACVPCGEPLTRHRAYAYYALRRPRLFHAQALPADNTVCYFHHCVLTCGRFVTHPLLCLDGRIILTGNKALVRWFILTARKLGL